MNKKQSAAWYIAATHWLTSGFVIPLISTFIIGSIIFLVFKKDPETAGTVFDFASIFYYPLVAWLGVMYSARYINKKYIIKNSSEIVKLSTLYIIVLGGGYRLFQIINTYNLKGEYIGFILAVVAFYIASKKYIRTSDIINQ